MTCDPSRHAAALPSVFRYRVTVGHERRAHRAFGKQIAQQRRDARGDDERVVLEAGAEIVRLDDVAHETQHPARERGRADESSGFRETLTHRVASSVAGASELAAGSAA